MKRWMIFGSASILVANSVYIEFQFSAGTNEFARRDASDRLKKIAILRKLEGCL
jgi:hypothetical protein